MKNLITVFGILGLYQFAFATKPTMEIVRNFQIDEKILGEQPINNSKNSVAVLYSGQQRKIAKVAVKFSGILGSAGREFYFGENNKIDIPLVFDLSVEVSRSGNLEICLYENQESACKALGFFRAGKKVFISKGRALDAKYQALEVLFKKKIINRSQVECELKNETYSRTVCDKGNCRESPPNDCGIRWDVDF